MSVVLPFLPLLLLCLTRGFCYTSSWFSIQHKQGWEVSWKC